MEKTVTCENGVKTTMLRSGECCFTGYIKLDEGLGYIFFRDGACAVGKMSFNPDRPYDEHITIPINCGDEFRDMTAHSRTLLPADTIEKALDYYEKNAELPPFITLKDPLDK